MERRPDPPANAGPATEAREETVERAIRDAPRPTTVVADPSSRRRVGSRMSVAAVAVAAAAALMAFVIAFLASGETRLALGLGVAAGLGAGIIAALVVAEREDGRIEREVEGGAPGRRDV